MAIVGCALIAACSSASADSVSDFFAGKTLTLIAGFPPGGGYDLYARVLARHYGRFIPGHAGLVTHRIHTLTTVDGKRVPRRNCTFFRDRDQPRSCSSKIQKRR